MTPFLITGCGRSGTAWAARLFTEMGYPCGHEQVFSPAASGPLKRSESSWLAVPHLSQLPPRTPVIRVMRDPYLVVQSVMDRGFLATLEGPYEAYVAKHRPLITKAPDHLGRAIRWVTMWDGTVAAHPHRLLRVEDDEDPQLVQHTAAFLHVTGKHPDKDALRGVLKQLGKSINGDGDGPVPSREEIDAHPEGWRVVERAAEYGYGG